MYDSNSFGKFFVLSLLQDKNSNEYFFNQDPYNSEISFVHDLDVITNYCIKNKLKVVFIIVDNTFNITDFSKIDELIAQELETYIFFILIGENPSLEDYFCGNIPIIKISTIALSYLAANGIYSLYMKSELISLDLSDICSVINNEGFTYFGYHKLYMENDNFYIDKEDINIPTAFDWKKSHKILLNFCANENMELYDMQTIADYFQNFTNKKTKEILFGNSKDENKKDGDVEIFIYYSEINNTFTNSEYGNYPEEIDIMMSHKKF
ncbi:hypothetical protein [Fusobacterium sp. PH5-44]|uniref:hypothetical protein n=1 Tax=unclassified Fusobacterium TaxID=2648384 RepID=UPI003D1C161E